jgi:hypothetical protein
MKKYINLSNIALLITSIVSSSIGYAYYDDKDEEKCREPKIQEFNLPEYKAPDNKEVPAEAEFSFVVSGWADPKKIKVSGKDKPIPFKVTNHETFHKVTGKLPAEYTGKYVRLNVRIPAILGCYALQGWLLKVSANSETIDTNQSKPTATLPATESTPVTPESAAKVDAAPAAEVKEAPVSIDAQKPVETTGKP